MTLQDYAAMSQRKLLATLEQESSRLYRYYIEQKHDNPVYARAYLEESQNVEYWRSMIASLDDKQFTFWHMSYFGSAAALPAITNAEPTVIQLSLC